jgi:long-chain alkane monooxygenase
VIAPIVADIRRRAAAAGRNPAEILIFTIMTVITAATSEAPERSLRITDPMSARKALWS